MMTTTSLDMGLTPAASSPPGAPPTGVPGEAAPDFVRALTDLLTGSAPAALVAAEGAERQVPAAPGKETPVAPLVVAAPPLVCEMPDPEALPVVGKPAGESEPTTDDDDTDLPEPHLEPALAWLMPTPPSPPVAPNGLTIALPRRAIPVICEGLPGPVADVANDAAPNVAPPVDEVAPIGQAAPRPVVANQSVPPAPATTIDAPAVAARQDPVSANDARPLVDGQRAQVDPPRLAVAPVVDAARAIDAAKVGTPGPRPIRGSLPAILVLPTATQEPAKPVTAPGDISILAPAMLAAPNAVAPTSSGQQAGLDLTRDPGLHRMIDHIAQLRDAADPRETRIRLIPDALGPVDIAVRREGAGESGGVQVHFTATEAVTRQLIADAQPRLAELAEARGLRIERAIIDGGATGDGQARPQPQQQGPATPQAPASAAREETSESTDKRIA